MWQNAVIIELQKVFTYRINPRISRNELLNAKFCTKLKIFKGVLEVFKPTQIVKICHKVHLKRLSPHICPIEKKH
jgi:hypothetical protein